MPRSNILVVVVDGLRASALGAYGNTSFSTGALDQFAADSLLFDWCYAPSAELADIYRALWHSAHPARPFDADGRTDRGEASHSLSGMLAARGYRTTLVTDEPAIVSHSGVAAFHECVQVAAPSVRHETANRVEDLADTEFARLFSAASEVITRQQQDFSAQSATAESPPHLVWVHARGMYGLWDAPLEFQQSLLDDTDPSPVESVAPPDFVIQPGDDPDAAFQFGCAYAAQVMVLDACWQSLWNLLESTSSEERWFVMLIGARGYPLGEHGRVGGVDLRLYAEQLQVPWLIHSPDGRGRLARGRRLVSHLDILPTLVDWIDDERAPAKPNVDGMSVVPIATELRNPWRDALVSVSSEKSHAIRTADWCLREDSTVDREDADAIGAPSPAELYVRPDDHWEANEVSKLCPDIVDELRTALADTLQRLSRGDAMPRSISPIEASDQKPC